MKDSILLMFHCEQNTGYAIGSLESVFYDAALMAGFAENEIFWSFKKLHDLHATNAIEIDYYTPKNVLEIQKFIRDNNIKFVFAFDLGFPATIIPSLKQSGIICIVSYIGASMSSINHGLKLLLKKIECLLRLNKPDLFIFESEAMRYTATHGRGLNRSKTEVIYLGVDTQVFYPEYNNYQYTRRQFDIPENRKIIFYSGHMEERKGVRVIMNAAIHLVDSENFTDIHFVICGNKNNEEKVFESMLEGTEARGHVTFAGYRNDIPDLMRGSHIGVIASTGWDSFTMSSVEMMASGLPLVVSDLQGLSETIVHAENGYLFSPGNHLELASYIKSLAANDDVAMSFSKASRLRAVNFFDRSKQVQTLSKTITRFMKH